MKNIFILYFTLILVKLLVPGEAYSQKDTTYRYSVRFGAEVSYPARMIFEPETQQYEASLDFEFSKNWFGAIEAGMIRVDIRREDFDYYSDGWFFRSGVDFNVLGREMLKNNDIVYFGIRYGYGKQVQGADDVVVSDGYWGTFTTSVEKTDFDVHWAELAGGVKTELFANIFIGWSVRLRLIVSGADLSPMQPYRIGGFGMGAKKTAFDFNYSIFYRIPF